MGEVINLNDWKKEHGIPLPRSPYYALKATEAQIQKAISEAQKYMDSPDMPYAAIVGYQDMKTGNVKLLKEMHVFSDQYAFKHMEGIRGHYCIGLVREE